MADVIKTVWESVTYEEVSDLAQSVPNILCITADAHGERNGN
jgi:hypothetical protein